MQWLMSLPAIFDIGRKPKITQIPKDAILNGTVWESPPFFGHIAIVLFLDVKDGVATYALLSQPYKTAERGKPSHGTAVMVCHYDKHTYGGEWSGIYSEKELFQKLSTWKRRPELELRVWNRKRNEVECPW
jgi:hypothetical protein